MTGKGTIRSSKIFPIHKDRMKLGFFLSILVMCLVPLIVFKYLNWVTQPLA